MFCALSRKLCPNHQILNRTSSASFGGNALPRRFFSRFHVPAPVTVFSTKEFGISPEKFCEEHREVFNALPPDVYVLRMEQIEFLRQHAPLPPSEQQLAAYYMGRDSFNHTLQPSYESLPLPLAKEFSKLTPWRHRAISQFIVRFSANDIELRRLPVLPFAQTEAVIKDEAAFDYRKWPRVFSELPESAAALESFQVILKAIANKIRQFEPSCIGVDVVVHHVRVVASVDRAVSNSPEGVHQDGFPYIVSALVVERENIVGAVSTIFGPDKETPLLNVELAPGMGVLQPDLGSDLWHFVNAFFIANKARLGWRSSIGFDIQPIYNTAE